MIEDLFPKSTQLHKVVPKKTLVEQLDGSNRIMEHLTQDIVSLEWIAKLASSTLNVADGREVHEITVFKAEVKTGNSPNDIFTFIDERMPRHALFILTSGDLACCHISFKEPVSKNGSGKCYKLLATYRSDWIKDSSLELRLEGQDLDAVYASYIRQIAGDRIISKAQVLKQAILETDEINKIHAEVEKLQKRLKNELQHRKQLELFHKINALNQHVESILNPSTAIN